MADGGPPPRRPIAQAAPPPSLPPSDARLGALGRRSATQRGRLGILLLAVAACTLAALAASGPTGGGRSVTWLRRGNLLVTPATCCDADDEVPLPHPGALPANVAWLRERLEAVGAGRARVVFHHVHKSGGTSMCFAMRTAGKRLLSCAEPRVVRLAWAINVSEPNSTGDDEVLRCNCNGTYNTSVLATGNPAAQHAHLRRHAVDAFFNEDGMADSPYFGRDVVHVVVVREPLSRYMSHMLHVLAYDDLLSKQQLAALNMSAAMMAHEARPVGDGGGIHDNYLTRYLAGWSVLGRPAVSGVWHVRSLPRLGAADVSRALANLQRMVVLPLDAGDDAGEAEDAGALLRALGLEPFSPSRRRGTFFSTTGLYSRLDPPAAARLRRLHRCDERVYAAARARYAELLEAFREVRRQAGSGDDDDGTEPPKRV